MVEYVIKEVIPKRGGMRHVHKSVLGCRCHILAIEKNQRGVIKFEPEYDPGRMHRLHTSVVVDVKEDEDSSRISIETENTIYVLERTGEDDTPGYDWRFSVEIALDDIVKYLDAQSDEYFTEKGTTKSNVLSDYVILANIRDD